MRHGFPREEDFGEDRQGKVWGSPSGSQAVFEPWGSQGLPSFICLWGVTSTEWSSDRCADLDGSRPGLRQHRLPEDQKLGLPQ